MNNIAVKFEYDGKEYTGILSAMPGAGGKMFYLMVRNIYFGCVSWVEQNDRPDQPREPKDAKHHWRFNSRYGKLDHLSHVFIEAVKEAEKEV